VSWVSSDYVTVWHEGSRKRAYKQRTSVVDLLVQVLQGTPRLDGALCRDNAQLFDAETADDTAAALALCSCCPALARCSRFAASIEPGSVTGVLAGGLYSADGELQTVT
jgi:hypothetical protein